MLSILLTLQYKWYATAKSGNEKVKTGGNCPKDVVCQKVSYNDMKNCMKATSTTTCQSFPESSQHA